MSAWYCVDCDSDLTAQEREVHECVGEDIPFMIVKEGEGE
jgi:hypothetical protein